MIDLKLDFVKLLKEGTISEEEITKGNPMIRLSQIIDENELKFELNIVTFVPENLNEIAPPSEKYLTLETSKIYFNYEGIGSGADDLKRRQFNIHYSPENENDFMLVYFRIIYKVTAPTNDDIEAIAVYSKIDDNQRTTRGTKTMAKIIKRNHN